jgi:hypothetical protein
VEYKHQPCQFESMDDRAFFWSLPALMAVCIALQLRYGRLGLHRAPKEWLTVERETDPGRFWLFIVAEALIFFILIGQAFSR